MTVVVIGQFRFPPERYTQALPMMRTVVEATRAEDGCIEYNLAEDALDPGLVRISEVWESRAHLDAHMTAPHMAVWAHERAALDFSGRAITVFDTSEPQVL